MKNKLQELKIKLQEKCKTCKYNIPEYWESWGKCIKCKNKNIAKKYRKGE